MLGLKLNHVNKRGQWLRAISLEMFKVSIIDMSLEITNYGQSPQWVSVLIRIMKTIYLSICLIIDIYMYFCVWVTCCCASLIAKIVSVSKVFLSTWGHSICRCLLTDIGIPIIKIRLPPSQLYNGNPHTNRTSQNWNSAQVINYFVISRRDYEERAHPFTNKDYLRLAVG